MALALKVCQRDRGGLVSLWAQCLRLAEPCITFDRPSPVHSRGQASDAPKELKHSNRTRYRCRTDLELGETLNSWYFSFSFGTGSRPRSGNAATFTIKAENTDKILAHGHGVLRHHWISHPYSNIMLFELQRGSQQSSTTSLLRFFSVGSSYVTIHWSINK